MASLNVYLSVCLGKVLCKKKKKKTRKERAAHRDRGDNAPVWRTLEWSPAHSLSPDAQVGSSSLPFPAMVSFLSGWVTGRQVFSHLQKNRFAWQCPEGVLYCHNSVLTLGKSAALAMPPCALPSPACLGAKKRAWNVFADTFLLRLGFSQPRVGERKQPHMSRPDPLLASWWPLPTKAGHRSALP